MVENLFKKKLLQDLFSSLNAVISTDDSTQIITGHVIYNLAYTYKVQLKTTIVAEQVLCKILHVHYWWFSVGICKYKPGYKSHDQL